ncbi:hypothetical protein [Aeromicrobium sp. UC242_57]|uniref:hypothetical protein n=1 Tax=Aeromicrobium sp. UC242_57 TaxID=3374624 RepID=UPI003799A367
MRSLAAFACILVLAGCGNDAETSDLSAAQAVQRTCEEVLAGIDDFNEHDLDGTIAHFVDAVPSAEAYAMLSPEPEARALLDAVRYYADLPEEDYLKASRTSSEFARHKAVTLSQCAAGEPIDGGVGTPT